MIMEKNHLSEYQFPKIDLLNKRTENTKMDNSSFVPMRSLLAPEELGLPITIGKTVLNEKVIIDLAKKSSIVISGNTKEKTMGINTLLISLLYNKHPSQLKFVLVDTQKTELSVYNKIEQPFFAKLPDEDNAIINDVSKAVKAFNSLCVEMDRRYDLFKEANVKNIKEYNKRFANSELNSQRQPLPFIVLVISEFADLVMTVGKEAENPVYRLEQLSRAVGIHLIVASARPSVNVFKKNTKQVFKTFMAFRETPKTILNPKKANQLNGQGELLLLEGNNKTHLRCGFLDATEINNIVEFIGNQKINSTAFQLPNVTEI